MTRARMRTGVVIAALLGLLTGYSTQAKSYSSGSRSYSSSRSSSGGGWGSSSHSSSYSSGNKGYTSANKSYSSGSSTSKSGKTYSSDSTASSGGGSTEYRPKRDSSESASESPRSYTTPKTGNGSFDAPAAQARQKDESTRAYNNWKATRTTSSGGGSPPPGIPPTASGSGGNYGSSGRGYTSRTTTYYHYVPSYDVYTTHHVRVINYYAPYLGRPVVYYHDPYSSFFWWWLLDQSLDTRAQWAYNHQYAMDSARYNALMADADLAARVHQLEVAQAKVNPQYVPGGMQQDLMYNDQYVQKAYRGTTNSRWLFWLFMAPIGAGVALFTIWLLFFKKWNVA